MKNLMIDVDDTIVTMIPSWQDWFRKEFNSELKIDNLGFIDISLEQQKQSIEWWKNPNLYDDKMPQDNSIEVIKELSKYYNVYFCSSCIYEHKKSKEEFIKNYFGNIALVDTHHKYLCMPDIVIDDRLAVLIDMQKYSSKTYCIHKKNAINSKDHFSYFEKWDSIGDVLLDKYRY